MKDKEKHIEELHKFMFFSKRKDLAEEYEQWVNTPLKNGLKIKDCALSVITFMQIKDYLKLPDSVVISKEEYGSKLQDAYDNGLKWGTEWGSKETAEKFIKECKKYKIKKFSPISIEQRETGVSWIEMPEWKLEEFAKQFGVEIKE